MQDASKVEGARLLLRIRRLDVQLAVDHDVRQGHRRIAILERLAVGQSPHGQPVRPRPESRRRCEVEVAHEVLGPAIRQLVPGGSGSGGGLD